MLNRPAPARAIPGLIVRPLQEFLATEAAGGIVLLGAAVAALLWVNAPFGSTYERFWGYEIDVIAIDLSLREWTNDALMALFFLVVGLEIKRELLAGELASVRRATLPVAAAAGGMVAPALIYVAVNAGGAGARGWGIPMATDIAFAVGVLALAGRRVPSSLTVFLLALAIVDDLGAIIVIAVFYSGGIELAWLAGAAGVFAVVAALGALRVRSVAVYLALGVVAWVAVFESGVHATIAGVVLGFLVPMRLDDGAAADIEAPAGERRSVLDRIEHDLHPWTSYGVLPIFALANAGIALDGGAIGDALRSPVSGGVALGLVVGKPAGILSFAWAATRLRLATLPAGVRWPQLGAVAVVAGIGFTVSLFISGLAFSDARQVDDAKMAILAASCLMGIAGYAAVRLTTRDAPGNEKGGAGDAPP